MKIEMSAEFMKRQEKVQRLHKIRDNYLDEYSEALAANVDRQQIDAMWNRIQYIDDYIDELQGHWVPLDQE